jgi:uncharacterized protein YegL
LPDFEQPGEPIPYVVLVIDESGSMSPSRETTVSAVNDYLLGLKGKLPANSRVTVVKFDSNYDYQSGPAGRRTQQVRITNLFDGTPLGEARALTTADYNPSGGTPLHDAVGRTIKRVDDLLAVNPGPVYFGVITDGEENSSTEYKLTTIKQLVDERNEKGWTFAFMGVEINAYAAGGSMGFRSADTVQLSRAMMKGATDTLVGAVDRKFGAYTMAFASAGGNLAATETAYAAFNSTDATFTDEERATLESDQK